MERAFRPPNLLRRIYQAGWEPELVSSWARVLMGWARTSLAMVPAGDASLEEQVSGSSAGKDSGPEDEFAHGEGSSRVR